MTSPEDALEAARAAASARREAGEDPASATAMSRLSEAPPDYRQLLEWALADPDLDQVRSTRRWGAPITAVKRILLRLLAQYHAQVLAEQARLNLNLVHYVGSLERRIERLEQERDR